MQGGVPGDMAERLGGWEMAGRGGRWLGGEGDG
jgi:hypothetical protein